MLTRNDLYHYQTFGVQHVIDNPAAGLFMDMGLGKTATTLTAIADLYSFFEISKVLVVAPLNVAKTVWTTEAENWEHLQHLRIAKVLGTEKQRLAALKVDADIYVINRENVVWLVSYYGSAFPFDMLVIDELSSFKSADARRFKALRTVRPKISRVVGLTGTPVGNGLMDLWAEIYLLDMGQRLGPHLTRYREQYFIKNEYTNTYKLRQEEDSLIGADYYQRKIYEKIADICVSMKTEDYLELPEKIIRDVPVVLSAASKQKYDAFEKEAVLQLAEEKLVTAVNAAALTTKLLQFANGAVYDEDHNYHELHDEKLEVLEEIVDTAAGHPVLIFYSYRHDLERIKRVLNRFKPVELKTEQDINLWNKKGIQVMLAHPASAGHGLNLQAGGNIIIWFGLTWSLELYLQANARIHRQGLKGACIIHRLITLETVDEDVVRALDLKARGQDALMEAVKARIEKYKKQFLT